MTDDRKRLTKEGLRFTLRELEARDRDRQSGEGPYSVVKFFAKVPGLSATSENDPAKPNYGHKWVTWEEAQEVVAHYLSRPGARQGALYRVLIIDGDDNDRTVFEWKHGEGVVVGKAY